VETPSGLYRGTNAVAGRSPTAACAQNADHLDENHQKQPLWPRWSALWDIDEF